MGAEMNENGHEGIPCPDPVSEAADLALLFGLVDEIYRREIKIGVLADDQGNTWPCGATEFNG
jgi:hypothetical protein